jgi:hypothetical protein
VHLKDGDEIEFSKGPDGQTIDPPNPLFCNVKLAIARVMHASSVSRIVDGLYGIYGDDDDDNDAIVNQPVYLGGPFVSDDTLCRRLNDRLSSSTVEWR